MISLCEPYVTGKEIILIKKSLKKKEISTYGSAVKRFEKKFSSFVNAKYSLALNSGTSALHLALKVVGAKFDNEVLVSTLTFVATINSIIYNGAKPVFIDCNENFAIDLNKTIEFLIKKTYFKDNKCYNKRTKKHIIAIVIVDVWGQVIETSKIKKICKLKNIKIIKDAAESVGSHGKSQKANNSTIDSDIACFSFNGNKIITTGSGGMLSTNNKRYHEKAMYYAAQAKNDKIRFIHNDVGYNYGMNSIQASIGLAQLEQINLFVIKKIEIFNFYKNFFKDHKDIEFFSHSNVQTNYWMNLVKFKKKINLDKIINYLRKFKIEARNVWFPNHLQKPFKKFERYKIVNAKKLVSNYLCVPSSVGLSKKQQMHVCKKLNEAIYK
tara:strand:- start:721 stop:1866 length:1146 start_codon:yes stop_codon:yes gene_type:complete